MAMGMLFDGTEASAALPVTHLSHLAACSGSPLPMAVPFPSAPDGEGDAPTVGSSLRRIVELNAYGEPWGDGEKAVDQP